MTGAWVAVVVLSVLYAASAFADDGWRRVQERIVVSSGTNAVYGRIIAVEDDGRMVVVRRRERDYFIALSSETVVTRGSECLSTRALVPGQAVIVRYVDCADRSLAVRIHLEPIVVLPPARRSSP